MSAVEIVQVSDKTYPNTGRHYLAEMRSGKHHATVWISEGGGPHGTPYLVVAVHNAANQCWRGPGKRFATAEAAIANYRTTEIKTMIAVAAELAKAPQGDAGDQVRYRDAYTYEGCDP